MKKISSLAETEAEKLHTQNVFSPKGRENPWGEKEKKRQRKASKTGQQ